jgi:LPXTG-motif cell wall-anchored protein
VTRRRPLTILMLLAALALALPAPAALAQSAGDNQYQDPFGSDTGGGGGTTPSTPSRPAQSGGGDTTPAQPSKSPSRTRSVPLARTGFDAWIPGVAGLVLLAGGGLLLIRTHRRPT